MWWYSAAYDIGGCSASESQWSALWHPNTTLKTTLFSNWGLHCSLKHPSPSHFAHNDVTNNNTNHQKTSRQLTFFRNMRKTSMHMHSCHWALEALQTINSGMKDASWSRVKGQKALPEHNEFSVFDWHFGGRRGDVFLVRGEHGCSVCGGGGSFHSQCERNTTTHTQLSALSSLHHHHHPHHHYNCTKQRKKPVSKQLRGYFWWVPLAGISFRLVKP